ncbi:MAG: hypothetical protein KAY32_00580 [Candidatus Eisenbacteria sp.]|nr:hypothetical protein [Candidatus Eisenbacteria bacterium]
MRLTYVATLAAMLALVSTPVFAEPIEDTFYAELGPDGYVVEGGGSGWEDGTWYLYPSGWWNIWFYDHPFDWERAKVIEIVVHVEPTMTGSWLWFVINWSTPDWSEQGNPPGEPRVPPIPPTDEALYIGREILFEGEITEPTDLTYNFEIWDYNPEWVSIDIQGQNVLITGTIWHECIDIPNPADANTWGAIKEFYRE